MPPAGRPAPRSPRPVGRPRANRRRITRPPQQEILFHAARLFARQGITATTTREIAAAAGLRQPSLFHWFANKDAIVEALLELSIAPMLSHAERCFEREERAALRLYRLLAFDARELCAAPYDLAAIWLAPEARAKRFERFWRQRERLFELVHMLVARGVRDGELRASDPLLAAKLVFGMDEGVLSWFDRGGGLSPEQVGDALAEFALRALLRDPEQVAGLRREAEATRGVEP
jgi:AcrR family transcriptional regulator